MHLLRTLNRLVRLRTGDRVTYRDLRRFRHRTRSLVGVTCRGKNDGGGAQLHAMMSAFAFCKAERIRYLHTPMTYVAHGHGEHWVSSWNNFVNFFDEIEQISPDVHVPNLLEALALHRTSRMAVAANDHFHAYCDRRPFVYLNVQDEFRRRCAAVKAVSDQGVMAVHIRRGDVMTDLKNARRRTTLQKIAMVIDAVRKKRPDLTIKVFSQGDPVEFASLPADELHLDSDVFDTMTALINSEVLLMAKSSFSYVAALLSRGTVIYEPFWHRPLATWIDMERLLRDAK